MLQFLLFMTGSGVLFMLAGILHIIGDIIQAIITIIIVSHTIVTEVGFTVFTDTIT